MKKIILGALLVMILTTLATAQAHAVFYIIQEDVSSMLQRKYEMEKHKLKLELIEQNRKIVEAQTALALKKVPALRTVNIQIIMTERGMKKVNAVTSKIRIKGRYIIIIANKTSDDVGDTVVHELGHIFHNEFVDLDNYMNICYPKGTLRVYRMFATEWHDRPKENFAEDFTQYVTGGRHEKRTTWSYSWKFKYFMRRFK